MTFKLKIQIAMGSLAFAIWSFMAWYDPSLRSAYVTFIISVVTGIAALALRDIPTEKPKEPDA